MAKNLRAKIAETDELIICDTNPASTKKFIEEAQNGGKGTHVAENPREVAQRAVSSPSTVLTLPATLMTIIFMF